MTAYYNEHDKHAAAWLRELIADGQIAPGVVDERSISDVRANELMGYTQCHFFAGIGVWSYALRLAGWPDDRPVWTGSCPCQPFSSAGTGAGIADERHLWPDFSWLIRQCRPATVFGEQVGGQAGLTWLDHVLTDLETMQYAGGAATFPAASVGAPHVRQRLYWMANTSSKRLEGRQRTERARERENRQAIALCHADNRAPTNGFWRNADWLGCRDGKWRPIKPGLNPLVNKPAAGLVPGSNPSEQEVEDTKEAKAMRLRGYGNAIVAEQAAVFISAGM